MDYLNNTIENMACDGLKVFSLAYKDISIEEMKNLANHYGNQFEESDEFRNLVESDLTYLCTFGFSDPLRETVVDTILEIETGVSRRATEPSENN